MPLDHPTRRRAITIFAATAAGAIMSNPARPAEAEYEWRGEAMGADAHIFFDGIDERTAQGIAVLVEAEIDRLENALSLFRVNSELCRLNRNGYLSEPSGDLRCALTLAIEIAGLSGGLF